MTTKPQPIGWIVLLRVGKSDTHEACSFGQIDDHRPELLARRGRATLFETLAAAKDAIGITYSISEAEACPWTKKANWIVVPVFNHENSWQGLGR